MYHLSPFVFFWPHRVFVAAPELSLVMESATLQLRCMSSRAWAQGWWRTGLLLHSMWNLLRQGTEPVSPASEGRFLTTGRASILL